MLSDDERELMEETLAKLEAEKARRNTHKDAPFIDHELPDGRLARVLSGVPRDDREATWYSQNSSGPAAPGVPEVSGADELVRPQHGIAAAQIFEKMDSLPSGPPLSGRVQIQVDAGDGTDNNCGAVAEADWQVSGDELVLKVADKPATLHYLLGRDPDTVAREALREQVKKNAFGRPLRQATISIV